MNLFTNDATSCRRLARGTWLATLVLYFGLLFLSLGYFGPYWAFVYWSVAALPLFLLTWNWLYRARGKTPSRLFTLVLAAWAAAFLLILLGNLREDPAILFWIAFVATGALPLLITWGLLRAVGDPADTAPNAAA